MASSRGTIRPVSFSTFHSLMCLHLEAVLLLGAEAKAIRKQDKEHSRLRTIWQRRLAAALVVFGASLLLLVPSN